MLVPFDTLPSLHPPLIKGKEFFTMIFPCNTYKEQRQIFSSWTSWEAYGYESSVISGRGLSRDGLGPKLYKGVSWKTCPGLHAQHVLVSGEEYTF